MRRIAAVLGAVLLLLSGCSKGTEGATLSAQKAALQQELVWSETGAIPSDLGLAGPFAGFHGDVLIVAGGANFPEPIFSDQTKKTYYSDIYLMERVQSDEGVSYRNIETNLELDSPRGYGASVATDAGLICIGGHDSAQAFSDVFMLSWNAETGMLEKQDLPALPMPLTQMGAAATSGSFASATVYLAGGSTSSSVKDATDGLLKINIGAEGAAWEQSQMPGGVRILSPAAWQHDGKENALFVFSGRRSAAKESTETPYALEMLKDGWKYSPSTGEWSELAQLPACMMAGSAYSWGLHHLFVINGADGEVLKRQWAKEFELKDHPGFHSTGWAYHTVGDTWVKTNDLPVNQLTTPAVRYGNGKMASMVIVSGEVRPKVRSNKIWEVRVGDSDVAFGFVNFSIILIYLVGIVGVGVFFYFRNKNVDDFFKGGGRIPFWVAAFSIFATMLSSITFIAVPGKVFSTNWVNWMLYISLIAVTPVVIVFFLPFFRNIKSASAYEYLEKRFNLVTRLLAGAVFMTYHILRMGIVMFLPALALSSIIKISPDPTMNMVYAILIMGILSIIYCSMGGLEAVVWTDTIQSFVLLGGAMIAIVLIFFKTGGIGEFFSTAFEGGKLKIAVPDFTWDSFKRPVLWVILLGGVGQNLIPYASDQAIIQRYMSVKDLGSAKKSIWTNTFISLVAGSLFFLVGTALFVFYKQFPNLIDPSITKVDAVFPTFIVRELPIGVAGLVVAAILAAAQSTVSTSINSATAVLISDFVIRFSGKEHPKRDLLISRLGTLAFGILGTACALLLVALNNPSLWDSFLTMLGLVLGALCGLFILGIFIPKANGPGVILGALTGVFGTWLVSKTGVHGYLFGVVNIFLTVSAGVVFSLILRLLGFSGEVAEGKKHGAAAWLCTEEGNSIRFSLAGMKAAKKK